MSEYYFIEVDIKDEAVLASLEKAAFENFACAGTQDFSIEEAKVDQILGDRSYSGGDLPLEVLEEVERVLDREGEVKKAFYFNEASSAEKFLSYLNENGLGDAAKLISEESKDWNETWKQSFKRIPVGEKLEIVPSWEMNHGNEKSIFIYPGMGFGTGNHETTYLCLKSMLEDIPYVGDVNTCLDFGCGSGILGIGFAHIKPDATRIDYLDIDQQALDNCRQNIDLNKSALGVKHSLLLSDQKSRLLESYDLVFANILLDALLAEAATIVEKTKKYLIVSGLLSGQEREVIEAYKGMNSKFEVVNVYTKNDWCAVLFEVRR